MRDTGVQEGKRSRYYLQCEGDRVEGLGDGPGPQNGDRLRAAVAAQLRPALGASIDAVSWNELLLPPEQDKVPLLEHH